MMSQLAGYGSLVAAVETTPYHVNPRLATGAEPGGYEGANPAQRFGASFGAGGEIGRASCRERVYVLV